MRGEGKGVRKERGGGPRGMRRRRGRRGGGRGRGGEREVEPGGERKRIGVGC